MSLTSYPGHWLHCTIKLPGSLLSEALRKTQSRFVLFRDDHANSKPGLPHDNFNVLLASSFTVALQDIKRLRMTFSCICSSNVDV